METLKISFAECNNKLAEALEDASAKSVLTEENKVLRQTEQRLLEELSLLKKEKERMTDNAGKLESEVAESQNALVALQQLTDERDAMRESILATQQSLENITAELNGDLKSAQLKLMESLEECQQLRNDLNKTS